MAQLTMTFTQGQFDQFARLSGDDNPIHVDPEFSARTRFGRTVAHGMFLFSLLQAEVARSAGGPVRISQQILLFRAPTFTESPVVLEVTDLQDGTATQRVTDFSGVVTTEGTVTLGDPDPSVAGEVELTRGPGYKGLEVGMTASQTRVIRAADVVEYLGLVADPNPLYRGSNPELPPPLLGGMVSWLLGVDLPGRGTNWLKQRYAFHGFVTAPAEITTTVTITRLRPDKGLVNLASRCVVDGATVVTGESLVLATDVAPR